MTYPLDLAYTKAMTTGLTLSGTATDGGDTYSMKLTIMPSTDVFLREGRPVRSAIEVLELTRNGVWHSSTRTNYAFATTPYTPLGYSRFHESAELKDAAGSLPPYSLPAYAAPGSSGSLGQLRFYSGATVVTADIDRSWTLEPSSGSAALACINSAITERSTSLSYTDSACLQIDPLGNVLGLKYTIRVEEKTLVFL